MIAFGTVVVEAVGDDRLRASFANGHATDVRRRR